MFVYGTSTNADPLHTRFSSCPFRSNFANKTQVSEGWDVLQRFLPPMRRRLNHLRLLRYELTIRPDDNRRHREYRRL